MEIIKKINYIVISNELITFLKNGKAEIYNDKIPEHLSIR